MANYKQAIQWLVDNDDTEWVGAREPHSVTAALVADLFGKSDDQVRADLTKALVKAGRLSRADVDGWTDNRRAHDAFERHLG